LAARLRSRVSELENQAIST